MVLPEREVEVDDDDDDDFGCDDVEALEREVDDGIEEEEDEVIGVDIGKGGVDAPAEETSSIIFFMRGLLLADSLLEDAEYAWSLG